MANNLFYMLIRGLGYEGGILYITGQGQTRDQLQTKLQGVQLKLHLVVLGGGNGGHSFISISTFTLHRNYNPQHATRGLPGKKAPAKRLPGLGQVCRSTDSQEPQARPFKTQNRGFLPKLKLRGGRHYIPQNAMLSQPAQSELAPSRGGRARAKTDRRPKEPIRARRGDASSASPGSGQALGQSRSEAGRAWAVLRRSGRPGSLWAPAPPPWPGREALRGSPSVCVRERERACPAAPLLGGAMALLGGGGGGGWRWWGRLAGRALLRRSAGEAWRPPGGRRGGGGGGAPARLSFGRGGPAAAAAPPQAVSELDKADASLLRKAHETGFLSWFRNGLLATGVGVISYVQSDMGREAAYGFFILGGICVSYGSASYLVNLVLLRRSMMLPASMAFLNFVAVITVALLWLCAVSLYIGRLEVEIIQEDTGLDKKEDNGKSEK
ncbi:hypothetical protein JRQ81_011379 [Phrynocephalus forsythii]|uniref:Transmembrane protein 160 n=1 Tax=Phrynocephalus forsythii TaxID=171643 RepID=A0A9Q0X5R7_9SAUR|nr:hypothetical protein JRQ81_011379 [Phrynocephalus forsythii]